MAHQTFYVEVDEEITSIVEKLKKAQANEAVMVVPKRALLIQSIINLRILKREADEKGIQLMIVTQDKLGKILIEKAGILVQQRMENNGEELNLSEQIGGQEEMGDEIRERRSDIGKGRLDRIGTEKFFDESRFEPGSGAGVNDFKKAYNKKSVQEKEILVNKELVGDFCDIKSKPQRFSGGMDIMEKKNPPKPAKNRDKVENFFYSKNDRTEFRQPKEDLRSFHLPKKTFRWFLPFGIFCAVVVGLIAVYFFVPKVTIGISVKTKTKALDTEILGDIGTTAVDYEKEIIPARIISIAKDLSRNFDSTGDTAVSNQKARGTVTIYNEYSSSSQLLVATTRLLTEDGKLFRLVSGVTVPGTTASGNGTEPGKIEAEVVADQPGEEYNIDPAKFSIPGFKDSGIEKYAKFYAKSEKKMAGGGSGGEKVRSITDADITLAKSKLAAELDSYARSELEKEAGAGAVLLDEAINKEEAVYKVSNSPGEVADNFMVTAEIKASAMVFSASDIRDLAGKLLAKSGGADLNIDIDSVKLDYGKTDANLKTGLMNIKFNAEGRLIPEFDADEIKKEILGKSEDYLKTYLSGFKDIEKADIEYQPSFIGGRIPMRAGQVEVRLDN